MGLALYLFKSGKGKSLPGNKDKDEDKDKTNSKTGKMGTFFDAQTKYKILITFIQILSKVAKLYPMQLPPTFLSFWGHFNVLSFDLSVIPINCITDSNFHDRLVATTVAPLMLLLGILILWVVQRQLIMRRHKEVSPEELKDSKDKLTSKTLRLSIICIVTVFPMVSTTIFQVSSRTSLQSFRVFVFVHHVLFPPSPQTFQYDTRLPGLAFLMADYRIQRHDPTHHAYVVYAALMAVLYCFCIPAGSLYALNMKKQEIQEHQIIYGILKDLDEGGKLWRIYFLLPSDGDDPGGRRGTHSAIARNTIVGIKKGIDELKPELFTKPRVEKALSEALNVLQTDPVLMGMSPLFQDYESTYWWFEVPRFVSTLILCGLVTSLPASGASQVFVSLVVSIGMFGLFANCKPYVSYSSDILAQLCQISLTFAMALGILKMASESFQVCMFV